MRPTITDSLRRYRDSRSIHVATLKRWRAALASTPGNPTIIVRVDLGPVEVRRDAIVTAIGMARAALAKSRADYARAMRPTIIVRGSHGELVADVATGVIVEARHDSADDGEGYHDIARFDPSSLAREAAPHGETDILAVGYWLSSGLYVEPLTMRTATDRRGYGHGMEFEDWVPLALLPSPAQAA